VKVVRLVNYIAPASGGLRTALRELGAGYLAAGHEPVLVMPGPRPEYRQTDQGLVVTVPGLRVPGTGGYRAIIARRPLRRLLDDLEPDRLEVSDRTTLRWTGAWARRCGVRSMMVSHDSLAALAALFRPPGLPVRRLVDRLNRNTAASFDVVVCTTAWAGREFRRLGVPNLVQVPLGVDLAGFHPARADESLRSRLAPGGWRLLVHCSRLSRRSARNAPSAPWPNCAAAGCPPSWSSRETAPGARRCRPRRPGCRSGSWGTSRTAARSRNCSRPRTW
jgi:alpha-1,6-mannosyltransferase